ncbi:MAG: efflux RND transporter periplasmic adaptor subunit [Deltaproteobacteria bacterium]|nr:efflux RND transporter periplasmic adaptor subunit [Deltaproteobacteria bacterium]PWB61481.1 MAG: efflux RND transporter periplasmic adaptor subunit [Deltaproteobacteria bacterium]
MRPPVIFCLCLLLLAGCSGDGSKAAPRVQPPAVPVTAAVAVRKDVPVRLRAIGTAEAYSTVAVKTMVNGQITKAGFREGQDVKKGDLIFVIDPRPYEAALKTAEAALARDVALKENAEKDVQRYAFLIEKDLVPKQQYDQVVANAAALEATVNADRAVVENARVQLGYCFIHSPVGGRTGNLFVKEGNVVKANDTSLVTIHQVAPIYVTFSVPERNLPGIRKYREERALPVEAAAPGEEGEPARGTLTFIGNAVDNATGTIQLKATFPNKDRRLWPGQFVNVRLILTTKTGAVLVPAPAVQTGQAGQYVFVVRQDLTVESRPVVPGETVDAETVIEKGVQAGERVVTDGQLRLVPGSRVDVKEGLGG